jgi:hypothetical protein
MQRQLVFIGALTAVLLLTSCGNKEQTAAGEALGATITMRDGTRVNGAVLESTPTEIKIAGSDQITRTIPTSQVKSIDYGAAPTLVPAPATQTSATTTKPKMATTQRPASAQVPAASYPSRVEPDGTVETHEHPSEAEITTKRYELEPGTQVSVRTEENIDSQTAVEGQTFAAEVTESVRDADGAVVIPRGANAQIIITSATKGGRIRGASDLQLDLKTVSIEGREYRLSTTDLQRKGEAGLGANKRTAEYSGGGAALGAIIGAIAGGGKGAAIGAGAGAGAGAVAQVATKGSAVRVPVETVLTFRLDQPLRVERAR